MTRSQLEKRQRILNAGVELARQHGYDGFSTRDVAREAGVALGTVYHNFTSKDHLLAEGLLDWLEEFDERLRSEPIRGRRIDVRLADLYERMAIRSASEPHLHEALRRVMTSSDESVASLRTQNIEATRRWFETAIGNTEVDDPEGLIEVLEYIFVGAFLMAPADRDPTALIRQLKRAVLFVTKGVGS
ncbi:MAG: TetR/AcrR family transcriptional regulator [bacterium]|nr:TetR/AcrR family transcriptional regulator [bacterium]